MATSRGPEYPDAIRTDAEFWGARPDQPYGTKHVLEWGRMAILGEAILQDEHRNAEAVPAGRQRAAFLLHCQPLISAAGSDNDGRAVCWCGRRIVGDRRYVNVG